jgi:hypothetical protein
MAAYACAVGLAAWACSSSNMLRLAGTCQGAHVPVRSAIQNVNLAMLMPLSCTLS